MKIVVLHSFYSEAMPSGENRVVEDQVTALLAAGHEVALLDRRTDELRLATGYEVRAAFTAATGLWPSARKLLTRLDPDIIHIHNTFPNWGRVGREWMSRTVVTLHNYRSVCANGLLFRDGHPCRQCLSTPVLPAVAHSCYRSSRAATLPVAIGASPAGGLRRLVSGAAQLIALNTEAQRVLEGAFGRPVEVIPNFVPRPTGSNAGERSGWIYVGRLSSEKGIRRLVEIWPSDEKLDIVGEGPLRADIERFVQRHPRIHMKGSLPRERVLMELDRYEGIVVPSMCSENLPTVLLEAFASGTPAVVSRSISESGRLETLGVASSFSPEGDTASLRAAMNALRPTRRVTPRVEAIYNDEFSEDVWIQRMGRVYENVRRAFTSDIE